MQDIDARIEALELNVNEVKVLVEEIHRMMCKADTTLTMMGEQVTPMLEEVKKGGIMKLLTGGFGPKGK